MIQNATLCLVVKIELLGSIIGRNDSIQTETTNKTGYVVRARIKWIGNCVYELTYLEQTTASKDSIMPLVQANPLRNEILHTSEDYYVFKSSMKGTGMTLIDTLRVMRD